MAHPSRTFLRAPLRVHTAVWGKKAAAFSLPFSCGGVGRGPPKMRSSTRILKIFKCCPKSHSKQKALLRFPEVQFHLLSLLCIYLNWFQLELESDTSTQPRPMKLPATRKQVVNCHLQGKPDSVRGFPSPTWLGQIWGQKCTARHPSLHPSHDRDVRFLSPRGPTPSALVGHPGVT